MHVLMTADTLGGVWTYTRELVSGLLRRGHRITLVSFGKIPGGEQVAWMQGLERLDYRPTAYKLEWMQDSEQDIERSSTLLDGIAREVQPDLLHLNQYAYGTLASEVPRVVVAHSDVVSWWRAVHKEEPPESPWLRWYRDTVAKGLSGASAVVTPSQWMLEQVRRHYVQPEAGVVIYNGRNPELFDSQAAKSDFVLSVGRVWDQGKQVSLLLKQQHGIPVRIVGWNEHPAKLPGGYACSGSQGPEVKFCGAKSQNELRRLYAQAAFYAATSCYEPFGLAPVEAALSCCALVANDIPVFHELWGGAAYFFRRDDPTSLAAAIQKLRSDAQLRKDYANRAYRRATQNFQTERMVEEYEGLYHRLVSKEASA